MNSNIRVFWALIRRDLHVVRKRLVSIWIDAIFILVIELILWGSLLPLLGMRNLLITPLFIGVVASQFFFFGLGYSFRVISDLKYSRYIDYQLTLPLTKFWLFASAIVYFMIEVIMVWVPFLIIGLLFLGKNLVITPFSILSTFIIFLLGAALTGTFFSACAHYYDYDWFFKNIWPRRLMFVYGFSPFYFLWSNVFDFSPSFAYIMLINPFTYLAEGLRSSLLEGDNFISIIFAIPALTIGLVLSGLFLNRGVYKRLDPV